MSELVEYLSLHGGIMRMTSSWPGTVLLDEKAAVFEFPVDARLASEFLNEVNGLFDWLGPQFLEDLCFLREDGTAWMTSIAHERDAFFSLSQIERAQISRGYPALDLLIER